MPTLMKFANKHCNPGKLMEDLAALPSITSVTWAGFEKVTARDYQPIAARKSIGYSITNGVRTDDFADPGELRFALSQALTGAQDTQLNGILAAHVFTVLSAEQVRQDQDEADIDAILNTERATYLNNLATWASKSTAQRFAACQQMFTTLDKLLRHLLRKERGAAI